jgi:nicotinamide-nucleotide amidase
MDLELVTIGTELLLGFTIDTNGAFLGQVLSEVGVRVSRRTSVGDSPDEIRAAVHDALGRTRLVLTTGGLGPTRDDMTKRVVAQLFGAPLQFDPTIWDALVARFAKFGRKISDTNRVQAEVPQGAVVLENKRGTAPGLWLAGPAGEVIMLPGVPIEMRGLMKDHVLPRLKERAGMAPITSLVLRTTSVPESTLAERLADVEDHLAPLTLAYLPGLEGVDLRLTAWHQPREHAEMSLAAAAASIRAAIGDHCYGTGDTDLASVLLQELEARGDHLSVAESCTGGMVGERITRIPGSSKVFQGGVIAYDNAIKRDMLRVPPSALEAHGAVSEAAVLTMAEEVARQTGATVAVSVSGVAGPDGGTEEKPVGTVWFGFFVRGAVDSQRVGFPGSRQEIRSWAAQFALHGLLRRVRATSR